jgi:hypothetical protein
MQTLAKPVSGDRLSGWDALSGCVECLSAQALEPNFTLLPAWSLPQMANAGPGRDLFAVHVLNTDGGPGAAAVFERRRWRWGLPLVHAESFLGNFPISGTPLVGCEDPAGSCATMLGELFQETRASAVLLSHVTGHHAVSSVLVDACRSLGCGFRFFNDRSRAALHCNGDHDAWFVQTFPRKRRKEFRRLKTRLAETGLLRTELRRSGQPGLQTWIDAFLRIEEASWKGRAGTALACLPAQESFVREALGKLDAQGRLMCWRMTLNHEPVAMMFGVRDGARCWIVKIAHAPDLSKFSPGVLLVLEATRSLFDDDEIMLADSCAAPDHPMIDHLWKDRLAVRDVLIGHPNLTEAGFSLIAGLEGLRNQGRNLLKSTLKQIRKAGLP